MKSKTVATPAAFDDISRVPLMFAGRLKTSRSVPVVEKYESYLSFLLSVSMISAPTKRVCVAPPIWSSFTKFPETIKFSRSVGSL